MIARSRTDSVGSAPNVARDAVCGEYIELGQRDAIQRLPAVLEKNDVVHGLDRIRQRRVLRLVD